MTVWEALQNTINELREKDVEDARLVAEILIAFIIGKERLEIYMDTDRVLTEEEKRRLKRCINRYLKHEPIQYITKEAHFMSLKFYVDKKVLIPRPETENLVERVIDWILENSRGDRKICEIGTGSGAIIVSILYYLRQIEAVATDVSEKALQVARKNAKKYGVEKRIEFVQGDMFAPLRGMKMFDVLISNPPYIPTKEIRNLDKNVRDYEPVIALDGGKDGLKYIETLIKRGHRYIRKGGLLAIEFGYSQDRKIVKIARDTGFYKNIKVWKDIFGRKRFIFLERK